MSARAAVGYQTYQTTGARRPTISPRSFAEEKGKSLVVELNGGPVGGESLPDRGSRFCFRLPIDNKSLTAKAHA